MASSTKKIAQQRICRLFELAESVIHEDEKLAQTYVAMARRIAMASRVRIPREFRRRICRGCKRFISPGVNCRVRVQHRREPHVVITCHYCGGHMRFPLRKRRRETC